MKTYICPKKSAARHNTIVVPYRSHFGHALPGHKQYWTLCAQHVDSRGHLIKGSELGQIEKEWLIRSRGQFHGVDLDQGIIQKNREGVPDACWHWGDFYDVVADHVQQSMFNPGIVNYDSKVMPINGCPYLAGLLTLLSAYSGVLFVCNLVLRYRHRVVDPNDAWSMLLDDPQFRSSFAKGWNFDYSAYVYEGTGNTHSRMGSFVFWK